ncbi:hypothetical protein QYF36_016289 [Acer negundo]|nr:hypothetical protein QYF36_016289 [Acer negundo]
MKKTTSSSSRWTTTTVDDDKTTLVQDETEENDDVFYTLGRNSTADYKKPLVNSSLENGIDFWKDRQIHRRLKVAKTRLMTVRSRRSDGSTSECIALLRVKNKGVLSSFPHEISARIQRRKHRHFLVVSLCDRGSN